MKRILKTYLVMLGFIVLSINVAAQGWAKKIAQGNGYFLPFSVHQRADNSFVIVGNELNTGNDAAQFLHISASGENLAKVSYDSISSVGGYSVQTPNGDFGLVSRFKTDSGDISLLRIDSSGQKIWYSFIAIDSLANIANKGIDTTNDNGFVVACAVKNSTLALVRVDSLGNTIWKNYYQGAGSYPANLYSTADGGFLAVMQKVSNQQAKRLYKVDASGNFLWQYDINDSTYCNATLAQDGNILVYGKQNGNPYISKVNQSGNLVWTKNYPTLQDSARVLALLARDNGNVEILSSFLTNNARTTNLLLHEADTNGNILSTTALPLLNFGDGRKYYTQLIPTNDQGFFLSGWGNPGQYTWAIKTDSTGRAYPNTLTAYVFNDKNNNCLRDSAEEALITNITLTSATDTFIVAASDSGYLSLGLNDGSYDISLETISPYWAESSCNIANINIQQNTDTTISLGYNEILFSPYIVMNSATTENVIPLFAKKLTYSLEYKNIGTSVFAGLIEVQVDTNLVVDSASVAWVTQNGNTYTFIAQQLNIMESAVLNIYYHAKNNLDLIDRTLCINAHAFSDNVYNASPLWDSSNLAINVNYNAVSDSVEFILENKGAGSMAAPQFLTVIEDNVILLRTPIQLNPNQIFKQQVPANGSTWRSTISQSQFNPYSKFATAAIEGAGTNSMGGISTGFFNQFPINGFYAYDYSLCSKVVASYDPNKKYVLPEGAGTEHLIDTSTELEYTITFQNTGNYKAYSVRIIDTLAPYLNFASIKAGISSHQYEMNFLSKNVVEFVFANINLPDSASDEEGSKGYVKFKIKQQQNNDIGTVINNNAAIYFDYNEPIITNTATVKIGEVLISDIKTAKKSEVKILAYPNPFTQQATIEIEGNYSKQMELNIFDIQGKNVKKVYLVNGNKFSITRSELKNGMYIFEIRSKEKTLIGTGKISVE